MDTTEVIVLALIVVLALGFFLIFRRRGKIDLKGPFDSHLKLEGSNDPAAPAQRIRARNVQTETGSISVKEKTGGGVDVEGMNAHKNVTLTSEYPGGSTDPKG